MSLVCFRNGSLAREWMRFEHRPRLGRVRAGCSNSSRATTAASCCRGSRRRSRRTCRTPASGGSASIGQMPAANVRGLVEGQMMAMANHAADVSAEPIDRIIATGGAATNRAILQVMANVFGVDVYRLDVENSAALGAALRAYHADRLAAGEPVSWKTVVSGFTDPNPGHRVSPESEATSALYEELRREYAMLEQLHKDRRPWLMLDRGLNLITC